MRYLQRDGHEPDHPAFTWLSAALIGAGVVLRLWQYLGRSALWTDEATLANNIVGRSLGRLLFVPLDHNQSAPAGFLLVEKAMVSLFGANELALRAFPLVCSILALGLLWRVARRLFPAAVMPLAIAPFALAPPLILFAAEGKQYSTDIAIALGFLLLALDLDAHAHELTARRTTVAAATGALAVWLSQPAVLVAAGLGVALIVSAMMSRERRTVVPLACVVGAWGVSATAATLASIRQLLPDAHAYMYAFWSDGFWPLSLRHPGSALWPFLRIASTLSEQLALPTRVGVAGTILSAAGAWAIWRRDRRTAVLLVAPLLVALAASAARLYPFKERLALFLIPSLLLLVTAGIAELAAALRSKRMSALVLSAATLLLFALDARALHAAPPVYRREEIAPAIDHLRQFGRAGDESYIYYGAAPAFEFYVLRDEIPASYAIGGCHRDDPRAYLSELDRYRGRARTWLLFAHELPRLRERELMLRYMNRIGSVRDSVIAAGRDVNGQATSVQLYLYDFSDPVKLRSANAGTFPIPAQPPLEARLGCAAERR